VTWIKHSSFTELVSQVVGKYSQGKAMSNIKKGPKGAQEYLEEAKRK